MSQSDFDGAIEAFREALHSFMEGDPSPVTEFFSRRDDVTLSNPFGPPRRGPAEVDKVIAEAAAMVRDGSVRGFEEISRFSTPDLGYVVELEHLRLRMPGNESAVPNVLRVTMIFRREGDTWKVADRHADPITTDGPIGTTIKTG